MSEIQSVVKSLVTLGAGIGANKIIYDIIKTNTIYRPSTINKVAVGLGAFAISGIVTDAARTHIGNSVDEAFETADKLKTMFEEKSE